MMTFLALIKTYNTYKTSIVDANFNCFPTLSVNQLKKGINLRVGKIGNVLNKPDIAICNYHAVRKEDMEEARRQQ